MFPHVRKLMSDHHLVRTVPTQLADTMAGFIFMALDRCEIGEFRCPVPSFTVASSSICVSGQHMFEFRQTNPCDPSLSSQPISTIRKKSPQTFAHLVNFPQNVSAMFDNHNLIIFDYRINEPFACSRCVICVSCSVHLILTYYVRKGSWAFLSFVTHNHRGRKLHSHE